MSVNSINNTIKSYFKFTINKISIYSINNTLKKYFNNGDFEQTKILELNNFIDKNLRVILQQAETEGAKNLQANLLTLSNKINREIDTPQAHILSFDIMGIALGLLSDKKNNYLQDQIPSEIFSIILNNLNSNNFASGIKFLISIERTSKIWMKEINTYICSIINQGNLSLKHVGCKTGSEAINYLIKNKLQRANLSQFYDITDENLNKLIDNCPNLHTLFVHSDIINEVAFEKLQALKILELDCCTQISEDKLAESLGKLTAIQRLNLTGCSQLSGDKLAGALGKLNALQFLDLWKCTQLSGDKLVELLGKLTTLQGLSLAECTLLSGDKLAESLGKLNALQFLELERCTQLSGDKLAESLGKLTTLQGLSLAECTQLSGDKLAESLGKLTTLQVLSLEECTQLSGDQLAEVFGKLTSLQDLNIRGWSPQILGNKLNEALWKLEAQGVKIRL